MGISSAQQIHRNRNNRESGAIVFEGPINIPPRNDGVIRFPDDDDNKNVKENRENSDDNIDLSGSFTPVNNKNQFSSSSSGTFANCGTFSQNGKETAASSNSGVVTYPNGTQIIYSKCHVVQTVNNAAG